MPDEGKKLNLEFWERSIVKYYTDLARFGLSFYSTEGGEMINDCIWFIIYLGMFVGAFSVGLVLYGTYLELRNKNDR